MLRLTCALVLMALSGAVHPKPTAPRSVRRAPAANSLLGRTLQRYKAANEKRRDAGKQAPPTLTTTASHLSADSLVCYEGTPRNVEGSLALKKASPTGALFDGVMGESVGCAARGYGVEHFEDPCYSGVTMFTRQQQDLEAFSTAVDHATDTFAAMWGLNQSTARLMSDCTCSLPSATRVNVSATCDRLHHFTGAWVHMDPATNERLLCDEGPFVIATYALAVLKGNPQLPMHEHDQVAAATCSDLGFPYLLNQIDHCFPPLYLWTRTSDPYVDEGCTAAQEVEGPLYDGEIVDWATARGMSHVDILASPAGCHCIDTSEIYMNIHSDPRLAGILAACEGPNGRPPVRDWWAGEIHH